MGPDPARRADPSDVLLDPATNASESGLKRSRETTVIRMQNGEGRASQRRAFRKMAKDMAGRYLSHMEVFNRRGLHRLSDLLSTTPELIATGKLKRLAQRVDVLQDGYSVSTKRRSQLEKEIDAYLAKTQDGGEDLRLGILSVLLERYAKRIPQRGLFDNRADDAEPSRPLTVDAGVADGARIHLLHEYGRPYFFGVDTLCDASSENAEQFLQLTARLVAQSETQLIRRIGEPTLASSVQHKLLRERATEMVHEWDFPQFKLVRRLADGIAAQCLTRSLEGNASLGGGATAFGIPQEEFDTIPKRNPDLARSSSSASPTMRSLWCPITVPRIAFGP